MRPQCALLMSRGRLNALALASLALAPFMLTGRMLMRVGAAGGSAAGGVAYAMGDLEASVKADPRAIEKASNQAFEALEISKVSSSASALDARIIGRTATDKKIVIKAKAVGTGTSELSIRVGVFGDEALSHMVYDKIQQHLPEAVKQVKESK